tara:strand:- start:100 stop:771 length:672 start_codon:yes stop_codon:yes gene_type:complete
MTLTRKSALKKRDLLSEPPVKIIQQQAKHFGYVCVENLYTKKELHYIKNEVKNIDYIFDSVPAIQERRTQTSGKYEDGSPKMTGNGTRLDNLYSQREYSPILTFNRKIFNNGVGEKFEESHPANIAYPRVNKDYTVLNRYSYGDEYGSHFDHSSFSALTFLSLSENKMVGGELVFTDDDISFKFVDNFCVIFPSWVPHHITKIKSKDVFRYSIAQFGIIDYCD